MSRSTSLPVVAIAVVCGAFVAVGWAAAQTGESTGRDTVGEHVVQPGETLWTITRRYLGTEKLWRENWRLNPQVRNPDQLRVGQRLQVILDRELPARGAVVETIANKVDKNQQQLGWQNATQGDDLKPRDGVRTLAQSSAGLRFDDGSKLSLTEYSQIFLKDLSTSLTGLKRGSIEVERGQVDLALDAPRPDLSQIEIVVGDTVTRPRPGADGTAETRARKPATGGSQLMVYSGSTRVEAGGQAVEVPRGMGTAVPEGGSPSPPERLLPRPALLQPGREERFGYSNPAFSWRPVPGASRYVVEVCSDPACDRLVARVTEVEAARWASPSLPVGELYFRVTAIAASGLDGYPSGTRRFYVEQPQSDSEPPQVVASRVGTGYFGENGEIVLGAGAGLQLHAHDDASGTAEVSYRWDSGEWRVWQDGELLTPASVGQHRLEVRARDRLGREGAVWKALVTLDQQAPAEPRASRQLGG